MIGKRVEKAQKDETRVKKGIEKSDNHAATLCFSHLLDFSLQIRMMTMSLYDTLNVHLELFVDFLNNLMKRA